MSRMSRSGGRAVKISTASAPEAVGRTVMPARCSTSRRIPRSSSSSSQTPTVTVLGSSTGSGETDNAQRADDQAVVREWPERPRLEPPHEETYRQVGGQPRDRDPDRDLAVDVRAGRAREGGELEDARREDDRGREQEGEAGGVLVVQAAPKPADHRHARAADPGEQREDLEQP